MIDLPSLPDSPLVSIIVPSFNQAAYIRETLDSVLAQDYRPLEVIVMDGASTDGTVDVLKSYDAPELQWTSEPDSGIVEAVNKGFAAARGSVLGIQSSDDCYADPHVVGAAVEAFRAWPEVGLLYGDVRKIDADGGELSVSSLGSFTLENLLCKRTRIPQESAFFRREALDAVGGWRREVSYAADTDLFLRMAFRTDVLKLDRVFGLRRVHGNQRGEQSEKIVRAYARMIDTCEQIAGGPRSLKKAAEAGKFLTAFRYNPSGSEWARTYFLYRARLAFPAAVPSGSVSWRYWVPGYLACLKALAAVKRRLLALLGKPRTSS